MHTKIGKPVLRNVLCSSQKNLQHNTQEDGTSLNGIHPVAGGDNAPTR